jgi:hypothetical protein
VSLVEQAVIDLVAGAAVWRVSGFQVDSFVHKVRAPDRHLLPAAKIGQSEVCFRLYYHAGYIAQQLVVVLFPFQL